MDLSPAEEAFEWWRAKFEEPKQVKALDFIVQFGIFSRENRLEPASKSEVRRWFKAGNVWISGKQVEENEQVEFPVSSCVLFPKGKRITLW